MKNLLIIGAGAFGREVRDLAAGIEAAMGDKCPWRLAGFLDDRSDIYQPGLPVLGAPDTYEPLREDVFVCAIGDPAERAKYAAMIRDRGGEFATLLDPSVRVGGQTLLGPGCVIGPFCVVSCNVAIGADTFLTSQATVGHDVRIGRCCQVSSHVFLGGGVAVGDGVRIFPHASVLPGIQIGDGATIGAGSVIVRAVPPGATVFGVPALPVAG